MGDGAVKLQDDSALQRSDFPICTPNLALLGDVKYIEWIWSLLQNTQYLLLV